MDNYSANSDKNIRNPSNRVRNYQNNNDYIFTNKSMFLLLSIIIIICSIISTIVYFSSIYEKPKTYEEFNINEKINKTCVISDCLSCKNPNICTECKENYLPTYEENGIVIEKCTEREKCINGPLQKCLKCSTKYLCGECNSGFFFPDDDKENCMECQLENCDKCEGNSTSNICTSCKNGLETKYNENNEIEKCICEEGIEEEKCDKCNENKSECIQCHLGYKLVNGACVLNYSFKAVYQTESRYENVDLYYGSFSSKQLKEMIIDGEIIEKPSYRHIFEDIGIHIVYFLVDLTTLTSFSKKFFGNNYLISIAFTSLFGKTNINSLEEMFYSCKTLISVDFSNFDTSKVTRMNRMFLNCYKLNSVNMKNLDFSSLKYTDSMFYQCESLTSIDISLFTAKNLITMSSMFSHCTSLISIDLSDLQLTKLEKIDYIFKDCHSLKSINFNNFFTDQVKDVVHAFDGCYSLTSLDLSSFNSRKFKDLSQMFFDCKSLTSLDLSNFEVPNINSDFETYQTFQGCINLSYLNIRNFEYKFHSNIFYNMPNSGTIIVHKNRVSQAKSLLPGWNVIE